MLAELCRRLPGLPPGARALVEDHVPWTAPLRDGSARRGDRMVDVGEYTVAQRRSVVVKPVNGHGLGHGVVLGCETSAAEWEQRVAGWLREGDHVVQDLVDADRWPVLVHDLAGDRLDECWVRGVVGPYRMGGVPAGVSVRHRYQGASSRVVNWHRVGFNVALTAVRREAAVT